MIIRWRPQPFAGLSSGEQIWSPTPTKFLSGQGNAVGGVVIDSGTFPWLGNEKFPSLSQPAAEYNGITFAETFGNDLAYTLYSHAVSLRDLGATMSPFHAWLTLNGVETLALRMERHCQNAQQVAEFLQGHPKSIGFLMPGLPDNSFHQLASKYLEGGAGSVFTFGIKGGYEAGVKLVESVELHSHVANIGDTRSLIIHPASTTHRQLTDEQRVAAGAGPEVIRLSVGVERSRTSSTISIKPLNSSNSDNYGNSQRVPASLFVSTSTLLKSISSDEVQNFDFLAPPDAEKRKAIRL